MGVPLTAIQYLYLYFHTTMLT